MQYRTEDGGLATTDDHVLHDSWPCEHKRKPNGDMETCNEAERRRVGERLSKAKIMGLTVDQVMEEVR